jgi:hypothetical protein
MPALSPQFHDSRGVRIQNQQRRLPSRRQIVEMQAILKSGMADPNEPLSSKAQAARAWQVLEDALWQERGKAKLAPVKPEPKSKRRAPIQAYVSEGPAHLIEAKPIEPEQS